MYKTKPIDYTGCNEIIADHLRRGLAIECRCWDNIKSEFAIDNIKAYDRGGNWYVGAEGDYTQAEPIQYSETKTMKQPVELMQALVDGGWKVDNFGVWHHETKQSFSATWWRYCGKESFYALDESWLDTTLKPVE